MLAEMLLRISERLLDGGSERAAGAGNDPAAQLRALIASVRADLPAMQPWSDVPGR